MQNNYKERSNSENPVGPFRVLEIVIYRTGYSYSLNADLLFLNLKSFALDNGGEHPSITPDQVIDTMSIQIPPIWRHSHIRPNYVQKG